MTTRKIISKFRYIKLGEGGKWANECFEKGIIRLGFATNRQDILEWVMAGEWNTLKQYWKDQDCGTPTAHVNQTKEFFEDDGSTLWVTFENGCLYHGFSAGGEVTIHEDKGGSYRRMSQLGWQNIDVAGNVLRQNDLSGRLTRTAAYRQTICKLSPDAERYLDAKIAALPMPEIEAATATKNRLIEDLVVLVRKLTWQDFELLVELIFASSGLKRTSKTGGSQKFIDLSLENNVTEETALVQIKSSTTQAELNNYIAQYRRDKSGYDKMFYVYHSGSAVAEEEYVYVWDAQKVAKQAVSSGLIDWLIRKAG